MDNNSKNLSNCSRDETVPRVAAPGLIDPGVLDRTTALCRGLDIILQHHGCRFVVKRVIIEQIESYLNSSSCEEVWLKRSKYLLTFPNAKYLKNDLPPQPDLPFEFSGSARKWVRNRINAFNCRNSHLWYSWLQGKRCSLPASDDFVEATYDDHFKTLSRSDTADFSVIDRIFENRTFQAVLERVRKEISRDIKKYYSGDVDSKNFVDMSLTGSSSACFERPRKLEGQLGELQSLVGLRTEIKSIHPPDEDEQPPLPTCVDKDCSECILEDSGFDPKDAVPFDGRVTVPIPGGGVLSLSKGELKSVIKKKICFSKMRYQHFSRQVSRFLGTLEFDNCLFLTTDLAKMVHIPHLYERGSGVVYGRVVEIRQPLGWDCWSSLEDRLGEWDFLVPCQAMIQAVREPFKVRVISKGNALPYYSCRRLQKILWKSLSEISCFRLISRPFCPTDLLDLKRRSSADWEWLSIDYSAATDGLSLEYSRRIMLALLEGQSDKLKCSAMAVLGPHRLYYPDDRDEPRGMQCNGQLMGSILSFPILCLANLGTYLRSMESQQHGWRDGEILSHVLINGDDMVYAGPSGMFEFHSSISGAVGLKMSPGKAYHHRTYLNINSTAIHYDLFRPSLPREIPYLNVGLYFGLHKVQNSICADDHTNQDKGVFSNLNHVLRGCRVGKEKEILDGYIKIHLEKMKKESLVYLSSPIERGYRPIHRNWFLPLSSGGMGVIPPQGWRFYVRPVDGLISKNLFLQDHCCKTTQRPLPGYEIEKLELTESVPWCKPLNVWDDEGGRIDLKSLSIPIIRIRNLTGFRKKRARLPILRFSPYRCAYLN